MFFRRCYSLKPVLLFAVNEKSGTLLTRIPSYTLHFCARNSPFSFNSAINDSVSQKRLKAFQSASFSHKSENTFIRASKIFCIQERFLHKGRPRYSDINKNDKDEKKDDDKPPQKLSLFQKFKAMYRDYWYVLVPVHLVTSAVWFGTFYYMARTGVDVAAMAAWAHLNEELVEKIRKSGNSLAGHLAIAYLLYKFATPLRYAVTVGGTTVSINYLTRWGMIKPIPKRDELKKMFNDKKVQFKKMKERHDTIKKSVKLASNKRIKKTSDLVGRMLMKRRSAKRG